MLYILILFDEINTDSVNSIHHYYSVPTMLMTLHLLPNFILGNIN